MVRRRDLGGRRSGLSNHPALQEISENMGWEGVDFNGLSLSLGGSIAAFLPFLTELLPSSLCSSPHSCYRRLGAFRFPGPTARPPLSLNCEGQTARADSYNGGEIIVDTDSAAAPRRDAPRGGGRDPVSRDFCAACSEFGPYRGKTRTQLAGGQRARRARAGKKEPLFPQSH